MKKLLSLFLLTGFIAFLIGCHAGGHGALINEKSSDSPYESAVVNANGKMEHNIVFNHSDGGQTVIYCDNGTFEEGVEVRVTETNTILNALGSDQNVYVYKVEAYKGNTPVQTLEKPLKISLPTNHLGTTGICYVGVRYSESDPWSYRMVAEDGTITLNTRLLRASENTLRDKYDCNFYRMGIQIALFLYNEANVTDEQKTNLVSVNKVTTTSSSDSESGNLNLSINMEGENLAKLDPNNISARITFKTTDPKEIEINGQKLTPVRDDKASDGKTYYIELPKLSSIENDGLKAVLAYSFNLKDLTSANFPEGFLIELKGKVTDSLIENFSYSEYYTYGSGSSEPSGEGDPETQYSVSIVGSEGTYETSGDGDYNVGDTVTLSTKIRSGYEFDSWTSNDIDVNSNSVEKSEKDGVYSISFTQPAKEVTVKANAKVKEEQSSIEPSTDGLTINLGDGIKIKLIKPEGKDYYLGEAEVTQAQYFKVMGTNPSEFKGDSSADAAPTTTAEYPVDKVSWLAIMGSSNPDNQYHENYFMKKINEQFADKLAENNLSGYKFSLPTVEQWECCFYAGSQNDLGIGENSEEITDSNIGDYAVCETDSPTEVKSKKPNAWGFYDMHGNVSEWTADNDTSIYRWYRGGSYKSSGTYGMKPKNQTGSSWSSMPSLANDSYRGNFGFRIALVPAE